jgi:uncharacterized membrane protein (DUF485 family)
MALDDATVRKVNASAAYRELTHKRSRLSWSLTAVMLLIYFAYIFGVAFAPGFMAEPVAEGAVTSLAIPLGVAVILIAIALTGLYVWRANGEFDRLTRKIVADCR